MGCGCAIGIACVCAKVFELLRQRLFIDDRDDEDAGFAIAGLVLQELSVVPCRPTFSCGVTLRTLMDCTFLRSSSVTEWSSDRRPRMAWTISGGVAIILKYSD